MTLDVLTPDPPTLRAVDPNTYEDAEVVGDTDYRREELESLLHDGAWEEAFESWAADASMDADDWVIVLALVSRFDFFWDELVTTSRTVTWSRGNRTMVNPTPRVRSGITVRGTCSTA